MLDAKWVRLRAWLLGLLPAEQTRVVVRAGVLRAQFRLWIGIHVPSQLCPRREFTRLEPVRWPKLRKLLLWQLLRERVRKRWVLTLVSILVEPAVLRSALCLQPMVHQPLQPSVASAPITAVRFAGAKRKSRSRPLASDGCRRCSTLRPSELGRRSHSAARERIRAQQPRTAIEPPGWTGVRRRTPTSRMGAIGSRCVEWK
jgi:hypothetical protein